MCQVSAYVKKDEQEVLLSENITKVEVLNNGVRISTLFEGVSDIVDMSLDHIDFSAGRIVLKKTN